MTKLVFYVDASGEHGLVARPTDSSNAATWEDAVQLVTTLGADWRLPTKQELNSLYGQKAVVGGFANGFYWSSTEVTEAYSSGAWCQDFRNGNQDYHSKEPLTLPVRAVRIF